MSDTPDFKMEGSLRGGVEWRRELHGFQSQTHLGSDPGSAPY